MKKIKQHKKFLLCFFSIFAIFIFYQIWSKETYVESTSLTKLTVTTQKGFYITTVKAKVKNTSSFEKKYTVGDGCHQGFSYTFSDNFDTSYELVKGPEIGACTLGSKQITLSSGDTLKDGTIKLKKLQKQTEDVFITVKYQNSSSTVKIKKD